jgi:hypothetical protein
MLFTDRSIWTMVHGIVGWVAGRSWGSPQPCSTCMQPARPKGRSGQRVKRGRSLP